MKMEYITSIYNLRPITKRLST